ncbi:MAG: PrsW family intramembrane metalloprotease, partial [Oscillospiraceae bacterium]|nr:PrsW family intramembrane metalloprotease [Oscillospiraceae bacterium]
FVFPILGTLPIAVYLVAALLPAFLLLRYVYRHDAIEKEPAGLLASLLVCGCLAALCSGLLEGFAEFFLNAFIDSSSPVYSIVLSFFIVAVIEEGTKLLFLRFRSWKHPAFNYRFDGVVYAVFVSLGFAALENVQYVVNYGLSVALPRALLAIPGHMSFAVFMGVWYGRARLAANLGDFASERRCLRRGYFHAVFLHGFYDSCAMIGSGLATLLFLAFVVILFSLSFSTLKRESAADAPITAYNDSEPFEGDCAE